MDFNSFLDPKSVCSRSEWVFFSPKLTFLLLLFRSHKIVILKVEILKNELEMYWNLFLCCFVFQ